MVIICYGAYTGAGDGYLRFSWCRHRRGVRVGWRQCWLSWFFVGIFLETFFWQKNNLGQEKKRSPKERVEVSFFLCDKKTVKNVKHLTKIAFPKENSQQNKLAIT